MTINLYTLITIFFNIIFTFTVIFLERKQPVSVYAWLLLVWAFPFVGFILYFLFSQKFSSNKVYRFRKIDNKRFNAELEMQRRELADSAIQAAYQFGPHKDNIEYHINVSDGATRFLVKSQDIAAL